MHYCCRIEVLEARLPLTVEIEPNDTLATATLLPANELVEGQVLNVQDVDHFRVVLQSGDHFRLQTANTTDARFSPTLPPSIDLLDATGRQLAATEDGRDLLFTAPADGDYFIRMDSRNQFGTFTEPYSMQTTLTAFGGVNEAEPNNATTEATALTLGQLFRGEISNADPTDVFSVSLNAGDGLSLDLSGAGDEAPGVRLLDASGTTLETRDDGHGLSFVVSTAGTYFLELGANANGALPEYSGVVNRFADATLHAGGGSSFSDATPWALTDDQDTAVGRIDSLQDADVYRIEVDTLARYDFNISPSGNDRVSDQSRVLTLYNQFGQFLAYSTTGSLSQERTDATDPGTYFLVVQATGEAGTGSYGIQKHEAPWYSQQRDLPRHFVDFDQQMPAHLGFDWVSDYAVPEAIPLVVGMFDARFNAYDIDVTTTLPTDSDELVTHGYGNFGDIGAGGFGGGSRGQRSTSGRAISSATQTSWNTLSYGSTGILNHEYGHAAGLPHARLPNAFMSYVTTNGILPVGQGFSFRGTDSRRAGFSVRNERNYLDWSLQAGAQVIAPNTTDTTNALDLTTYFVEMGAELERQPSEATGSRPNLIRAADIDGDGDNDLVVANSNDNTIQTFIGDGAGGFQVSNIVTVNGIGWWTEPIVVGDFNADGRDDVASISYGQRTASILLGQINGNLSNPTNIDLGASPQSIAVGDFDDDDNLDLVVATVNDQVRVLLGAGNGNFATPVSYAAGDNPYSVTVGDFDGDGVDDVATANNRDDTATFLLSNGDGTLQAAQSLPVAEDPRSIASDDFNGDGRDDLAIASRAGRAATVFLAQAAGGFSAGVPYSSHDEGQTITVGDANRDGQSDLLIGGFDVDFRVLLGAADGTFSRPVSIVGGDSEVAAVTADFAGDAFEDLVVVNYWSDEFALYTSLPNDVANDVVTLYGEIESADDSDFYRLNAEAGEQFTFDIDAAEFQYSLDATLRVLDSAGNELAANLEAIDWDSGLDSVDPFISYRFAEAGEYVIEVSGQWQTRGNYRLKVTPERAFTQDAPRMIASVPDAGASVNAQRQIMIFFDNQLDPSTLTAANVTVEGASSGLRSGTLQFDPLDSVLVWMADADLPADTYTITLRGGSGGLADFHGNLYDGELANNFAFPLVSGDGTAGGDSQFSFTITGADNTPAAISSLRYNRDPYQRGRLNMRFNDNISWQSVETANLVLRGSGPDSQFDTNDDVIYALDVNYDKIDHSRFSILNLYTRGVPDPDLYRLQGTLVDAAGHTITLNEELGIGSIVSEAGLFQDAALSEPGLEGSYVNQSLRNVSAHDDWRTTQTISGTRTDYAIDFLSNSFGTRADVGITGGTDDNWDNFSVQWDGWINIPVSGTRLQTRSDDGSRLWVDVNDDGTFASDNTEFWDNGWGTGHGIQAGALTAPLDAGAYRIRVQYEEGSGGNAMALDWLTPGFAGEESGYGHGPAVVGMNVQPGTAHEGSPIDRVQVQFSGAVDTSTLNTNNFQVWYSPNPDFFDGNDLQIVDADGSIAWDAPTRTATLQPEAPLGVGYYRVELNGDADGILSTAGLPLDGEFLSSYIPGNTNASRWANSPSGDGLPGGDYAAIFSIAVVPLSLQVDPDVISEVAGQTTVTLRRLDPNDLGSSLNVQISSDQPGRLSFPTSVVIPAGSASTSFVVDAIDNSLLEGPVDVLLTASSDGYRDGSATITILDYEELAIAPLTGSISEFDGITQLQISRDGSVGNLLVDLNNGNSAKLSIPSQVMIPDGQSFVLVDATAIDNSILDGSVIVPITVTAPGMIDAFTSLEITDFEPLEISITEAEIRETAGVSSATVTRTDPAGDLVVQLSSLDTSEATVPSTILIPDGQLTSAPFQISAVSDGVGDGDQTVSIRATALGYVSIEGQIDVLDDEALLVVLDPGTISEFDGQTTARVRRLTSVGNISVQLSASDPAAVDLPANISIADGSFESDPFEILAVDNSLLDGSRTVMIQASSTDYFPGNGPLIITDYEQLVLSFVGAASISEKNGQSSFTVTRVDATDDLIVDLQSSDTSELTVPSQITIPAGSLISAPIPLSAVDDQLLDGTQTVSIAATATGYIGADIAAEVTDIEDLDVAIAAAQISESGGQTEVTISRLNTNLGTSITVSVQYSDTSEITGPTEIVFDPFIASRTITLDAVDDTLLDGSQTVTLSFSSPGYEDIQQQVEVLDFEELTVSFDTSSISESNGTAVGTISRPQAESGELVVTLTSSDTSELTVPSQVIIPADAQSATFDVSAVDDTLLDGNISVSVTATAAQYLEGSATVLVTDHETLLVTFEEPAISEQDGSTRVTISREGNTDAPLSVAISSDPEGGLILPPGLLIPAGQSSAQFSVRSVYDPAATGTKSMAVVARATNYLDSSSILSVLDTDPIEVDLSEVTVSEAGGSFEVTVTRGGVELPEVTLDLIASLPSQTDLPPQITIPQGQSSSSLLVSTLDNTLLDGTRDVEITAGGNGFVSNSSVISITDVEFLTVSLPTEDIQENEGDITFSVSRSNTDTASELIVQLDVQPSNALDAPSQIVIPAGAMQVSVIAAVLDDRIREPDVTVQFTTTAEGYEPGTGELLIADNDLYSWTNHVNPFDVNNDGFVSAIDALLTINELNATGGRPLPPPDTDPGVYFDVSEDEFLSAVDALMVINELNRPGGTGEGENSSETPWIPAQQIDWGISDELRKRKEFAGLTDEALELLFQGDI